MIYFIFSVFLFLNQFFLTPIAPICSFVWLMPLIIKSRQQKLTFIDGFLWGLLVFGIHLSWLLVMLVDQSAGLTGIIIWVLTILWFCIASGIWMAMLRYSWFFATMLFLYFLMYWSLLPLGVLEGYPLINPLISLVCWPASLYFVQRYAEFITFALMIGCSWSLAQMWLCRQTIFEQIKFFVLAMACLLPFAIGYLWYEPKTTSMHAMAYCKPWWHGCHSPMFAAYRMVDDLNDCMAKRPDVRAIVYPESTFCFDFVRYQHFVPIWCDNLQNVCIVFGTHCNDANVAIMMQDGKVTQIYQKQHFMPFLERAPRFFSWLNFVKLLDQKSVFQNDVFVVNGKKYQIFMCSELFFQSKVVKGYPILLLWNESWLVFNWLKNLAEAFIKYFSIKNNVAVIHASTQGRTNIEDYACKLA
jgi:hypothetical protein